MAMIYAAELRDIEMALTQIHNIGELASRHPQQTYTAIIFTDNQAAIQACSTPGRSSGQYIPREITRTTSQLQERGWNIQLYWLPGNEGNHGNECADTLAKEAANSLTPNTAEELTLMASTRRTLRIEAASAWKTEWATTTHGNSELGPFVDQAQHERILMIIDNMRKNKEGNLLQGGEALGSGGFHVESATFEDTGADASISRDEIFGSVVAINRFKPKKEAIDLSNDFRYGLMTGAFTQDINRALRLSEAFNSGVVGINCINTIHFSCPFGGTKSSKPGSSVVRNSIAISAGQARRCCYPCTLCVIRPSGFIISLQILSPAQGKTTTKTYSNPTTL